MTEKDKPMHEGFNGECEATKSEKAGQAEASNEEPRLPGYAEVRLQRAKKRYDESFRLAMSLKHD